MPRAMHQVVVTELVLRISSWLEGTGAGHVLASPADLSLGEDEVLQPDVFVYRTASGRHLRDWDDISELVLVIEVLSPSTARYDRQLKRRRYQRARVPEYWIFDIDSWLVERWRPDDERPELLTERLTWEPPGSAGQGRLDLDLSAFFTDLWGED